MNKAEFISQLSEVMQTDKPLFENSVLADFEEWDSLAVMGVISLIDENFHKSLTFSDLNDTKTVSDLIKIAGLE